MNRRFLLALATAACAILLAAAPHHSQAQAAQSAPAKTAAHKKPSAAAKPAPAPAAPVLISVNGVKDIDPQKATGNTSAPVTMEVFSDFQCPACKQLYTNTTNRVIENYVNTGKVYFVHRDFPLPMHAYSRVAASYSRAAAHIGKCDAVEHALFEKQAEWEATGKVKETVASVLTPVEMKKVQALVDAGTLEPLIEQDKKTGQLVPVNQTPTAILTARNGQSYPVVGFVSYDVLKTFLDQLIAQK